MHLSLKFWWATRETIIGSRTTLNDATTCIQGYFNSSAKMFLVFIRVYISFISINHKKKKIFSWHNLINVISIGYAKNPIISKGKYHINAIDHLIPHVGALVSLIYTFSSHNGVIPCNRISESSLLVAMYTVVVIGHVVYFFSTPSRFSIIAKVKPSFLIGPVYFHRVKYFWRII